MKEQNKNVLEFTPAALSAMLKAYVKREGLYTNGGAVDFHKLASVAGVNHETIRRVYHGRHENPTWQTISKVKEMIGFEVNIAR